MVHRDCAAHLFVGALALGGSLLIVGGQQALAQDTDATLKILEAKVAAARTQLEAGAALVHVQGRCNMVWADVKHIEERLADDELAMTAAGKASEACDFEIPVAYFERSLSAARCDAFIAEVQTYFDGYRSYALGILFGDGTPDQQAKLGGVLSRFKAAISDRVSEACPTQGKNHGY